MDPIDEHSPVPEEISSPEPSQTASRPLVEKAPPTSPLRKWTKDQQRARTAKAREAAAAARKEKKTAIEMVQAGMMLQQRIVNTPYDQIAELFNLSAAQVKRQISWAQDQGVLTQAQSVIQQKLIPRAVGVYMEHLEKGDMEAARDVLYGMGVLSKSTTVKVGKSDDELEAFRAEYQSKLGDIIDVSPSRSEGPPSED